MNSTQKDYDEDPRAPCKYGINCYQKNSLHISKYKHPPKRNEESSLKNNGATTENNNKLPANGPTVSTPNMLNNVDERDFIKRKFLVDMPPDFYSFWNFSKNLNSSSPLMALKDVGLILVGPFEVLAGKFNNTIEKDPEEYVLHWRYFYDPPEFQTVIRRNDNSGYHLGYFRDSPEEMPIFLAYNVAKTDENSKPVYENNCDEIFKFNTKGSRGPEIKFG
ncbi:hypothetical protein Trydic_g22975 [Trypoxylus dichotomus]